MQKELTKNVKIVEINGKIQILQDSHLKAGAEIFSCSDLCQSLHLLAEGESEISESESRTAKVTITDLSSRELKGNRILSFQPVDINLIFKAWC